MPTARYRPIVGGARLISWIFSIYKCEILHITRLKKQSYLHFVTRLLSKLNYNYSLLHSQNSIHPLKRGQTAVESFLHYNIIELATETCWSNCLLASFQGKPLLTVDRSTIENKVDKAYGVQTPNDSQMILLETL